mgnify:CR=1 FL=1
MSTAAHEAVYASVAKPWLKYYDASFIGQPLPDCTTFEYLYQQNKQHKRSCQRAACISTFEFFHEMPL